MADHEHDDHGDQVQSGHILYTHCSRCGEVVAADDVRSYHGYDDDRGSEGGGIQPRGDCLVLAFMLGWGLAELIGKVF